MGGSSRRPKGGLARFVARFDLTLLEQHQAVAVARHFVLARADSEIKGPKLLHSGVEG
jgi:hypothetical protein